MEKNNYLILPLRSQTTAALTIYNRWGKEVFSSENYQNDWSAEGLPSGTYYASLEVFGTGQKLNVGVDVRK